MIESIIPSFEAAVRDREALVVVLPGTPLQEIEKSVILATLRKQRFNRTRTARTLGIGIRTLQRRLKEYRSSGADASLDA